MSTSTGEFSKTAAKRALVYLVITAITALCGGIYECFGHGVYSYYMIYAFAIPLMGGVFPNLAAALVGASAPHKAAYNLYNSGLATLTVGCIFEGVLEIYGTANDLVLIYLYIGACLLLLGIIAHVIFRIKDRAKE